MKTLLKKINRATYLTERHKVKALVSELYQAISELQRESDANNKTLKELNYYTTRDISKFKLFLYSFLDVAVSFMVNKIKHQHKGFLGGSY